MGTEVLPPQNLLAEGFRVSPAAFHRRRNVSGNGNLSNVIVNRKPGYNTGTKKAYPKPEKKKGSTATVGKKSTAAEVRRKDDASGGGLVMGQVMLLKRGESFDSLTSKMKDVHPKSSFPNRKPLDDLALCGNDRIGPDSPGIVPKQVRLLPSTDGYAGSAFSLSPSPRSVPLPSFFKKLHEDGEMKPFDDSATQDLRRLLRLE